MELSTYILTFLKVKERVVIPKIGAFTIIKEDAKYKSEDSKILPPKKSLKFDPKIEYPDEIFIEFLSTELGISYREAEDHLKNFVDNILEQLNNGNAYSIQGLGKLNKKNDQIVFLVDPNVSLIADSFGLPPIKAKKITKPQPIKKKIHKIPLHKKIHWVYYASAGSLIGIFAILVILSLYTDLLGSGGDKLAALFTKEIQDTYFMDNQSDTETIEADTSKEDMVIDSLNKLLDKATDKKKALFYEEPPNLPKYSKFILIAGSFSQYENAEIYCNDLKNRGFQSQILRYNNQYRVTLKTYDNQEDALERLYQLREQEEFKSIWILKGV